MRSNPSPGQRYPTAHPLLALGPIVVLLAWFVAGQWDAANDDVRAWLLLIGAVGVASLLPLPGVAIVAQRVRARVFWWGWVAVVGLIAAS